MQNQNKINTYDCEVCGFSGKLKTHLQAHLNTRKHKVNMGMEEKVEKHKMIHYCGKCDYSTDRLFNLKTHIENKHSNKTINCEYCNKKIKQDDLDNHRLLDSHRFNVITKLTSLNGKVRKIKTEYQNLIKFQKIDQTIKLKNEYINSIDKLSEIKKELLYLDNFGKSEDEIEIIKKEESLLLQKMIKKQEKEKVLEEINKKKEKELIEQLKILRSDNYDLHTKLNMIQSHEQGIEIQEKIDDNNDEIKKLEKLCNY